MVLPYRKNCRNQMKKNLKENGRESIASDQKKRSRKTVTSSKIIKCTEKDLKLWGPFVIKKITNNTATRKSVYEKLLQVAKSNNVPRKWKILRYIVKHWKIKTCNPKKLAKYQYVYQWSNVSKNCPSFRKAFEGGIIINELNKFK